MKRNMVWAIFALAAVAVALAPSLAAAQATSTVTSTSIPMSIDFTLPNGDYVMIAGDVHLTTVLTTDAHGGFHMLVESNPQGLTGVSDFGVTYHGVGVQVNQYNLPNRTFDVLAVHAVDLIGDGPDNNLTWHVTALGTINPDKTITWQVIRDETTFGAD